LAKITYDNSTYHTRGELPTVGSHVPEIRLVDTRLKNTTLADWLGKRKIINIFESIDTPVSAKSVIEFDRLVAEHEDVAALMISYDLPFAHARFQKEHGLQHVAGLSAIRHAGFGENYGVEIVDGPLAGMFCRAIVVVDENNTVVHTQQLNDIATEPDYEAAFRALGIKVSED
jgi:thiol peroxidase